MLVRKAVLDQDAYFPFSIVLVPEPLEEDWEYAPLPSDQGEEYDWLQARGAPKPN